MEKKIKKIRDHRHYKRQLRGTEHSICNLEYTVPKNIPIIFFHNGSIYDYHFVIKKLAKEFKNQFTCLTYNTENTKILQFNSKRSYKN